MEPGLTRDVHRSLMSALHRTGATATELLNTTASLRWDAAWKSSVSGSSWQREKKAWWNMVGCLQAIRHGTSPITQRRDWISGQGGFVVSGAGGRRWRSGLSNTSARRCDKSRHDCFQTFLNLHELNIFCPENLKHVSPFHPCMCPTSIHVQWIHARLYIITCVHASELCVWAGESHVRPNAPAVILSQLSRWAPVLLHYIPLILKLHMKPDSELWFTCQRHRLCLGSTRIHC